MTTNKTGQSSNSMQQSPLLLVLIAKYNAMLTLDQVGSMDGLCSTQHTQPLEEPSAVAYLS